MIGNDFSAIRKCYDLKGSLLGRITKISNIDKETGETGLKVLKDINFLDEKERLILKEEEKVKIIKIM